MIFYAECSKSSLRQKQSSANEGRSKTFVLIMPSAANLRCSAVKEVKGESRDKRKRSFQVWLCRAASYLRCARSKVVQTRAEKTSLLDFLCRVQQIFAACSQRSERREQRQTKTKFSSLAMPSRLLSSLRCFPAALSLYYSVCYYMFHFLLLWKNVVTSPLRGGVVLCNRRYSQIKVLICREL